MSAIKASGLPEARRLLGLNLASSGVAALSGRLLYATLLLALLFSPFEAAYPPLISTPQLRLTNLEAALFLVAFSWAFKMALDAGARLRFLRLPLLLPIAMLLGASVVSTIFGEYTAMGGHFIYRLLMGAIVFAATAEAIDSRRKFFTALGAFVGAGAVAALLGLLEFAPWLDVAPWLAIFKPAATTVGGVLRLSGSFEYANGAALFFELALPVLIGLLIALAVKPSGPHLFDLRAATRRAKLLALGTLLLLALLSIYTVALLLTLSRAALAGFALALLLIGLGIMLARMGDGLVRRLPLLRPLGLALAAILLASSYLFFTQPMFRIRLTTENDRDWYRVGLIVPQMPQLNAGGSSVVPLTIHNESPMIWRASGPLRVQLSYHWLSADKSTYAVFEGARTHLTGDLQPGQSVTVDALVLAPQQPGEYQLQWDLVQENVTWFSSKADLSSAAQNQRIGGAPTIAAAAPPPRNTPLNVSTITAADTSTVSRLQLWRVALDMFRASPLIGVGPDGFRNLYGKYAGISNWNSNIYTNNTYLEMFANLGALGGLAFVWLALAALWRAGCNIWREPLSAAWSVGLGVAAALGAFFAHSLVDYFLFSTPLYTIFWFLLGVGLLWPRMTAQTPLTTVSEGR